MNGNTKLKFFYYLINPTEQGSSLGDKCTVTAFISLTTPKILYLRKSDIGQYTVPSVPVTTAWRVLRLRIEERPPIRRVAANKLNKQSRTADEGWSSSLGGLAKC